MLQTNQHTRQRNRTQDQRILWLLQSSWPAWTPAPTLATISLQYAARIFDLRQQGWAIENRVTWEGGKRHGFYRLGSPGPAQPPLAKPEDNLLFPPPERSHRDDN